jgi:hypothetical protein
MSRWSGVGAAVLCCALLWASGARASNSETKGQCLADARSDARTCVQVCRDDFRAAKDSCRDVDHDCAEAARAQRELCVGDVLAALGACVESECAPFTTQIGECRATYPLGDPQRDACIDNAQLLRFQCRDACRESVQLFVGLKACRVEFRAAILACPKPEDE